MGAIEALLSLPDWLGILFTMLFTTGIGIPIYLLSHRYIQKNITSDMKDPTGSLFRVIGMLVSLMLSLAFADVLLKKSSIEDTLMRETTSIADAIADLQSYGTREAKEISALLVDYAVAVVEHDWPALANDRLSNQTLELKSQIYNRALLLEASTPKQEILLAGILADIDAISDFRLIRLTATLAHPPIFLYVVLIGFFLTMACFGSYKPQKPLVILVSAYAAFV
ncbi:MAG: hypothetical protein ABJJ37_21830, partial [Roseibium sp.]